MISDEQREAISDDFQSTFAQPSPGVLQNLFYESEKETVEAIIRKHVPNVGEVRFHNLTGGEYPMWAIAVLPKIEPTPGSSGREGE